MHMHWDRVARLIARAQAHGAERVSVALWRWDIAGRCERPYSREIIGRPEAEAGKKRVVIRPLHTRGTLMLEIRTPCHRCETCRRIRGRLWTMRAKAEFDVAVRTWFGTLTLSPESAQYFLNTARWKDARQGIDFETLPETEQFLLWNREVQREVTKYLKRIRKESGASFRYLCVTEVHKSGIPHMHMLLHESVNGGQVKHATLSAQWRVGFERWRLAVDKRSAAYLCKYLSKDAMARVRASLHYGENTLFQLSENLQREKLTLQTLGIGETDHG